jgi:hypothetical protein
MDSSPLARKSSHLDSSQSHPAGVPDLVFPIATRTPRPPHRHASRPPSALLTLPASMAPGTIHLHLARIVNAEARFIGPLICRTTAPWPAASGKWRRHHGLWRRARIGAAPCLTVGGGGGRRRGPPVRIRRHDRQKERVRTRGVRTGIEADGAASCACPCSPLPAKKRVALAARALVLGGAPRSAPAGFAALLAVSCLATPSPSVVLAAPSRSERPTPPLPRGPTTATVLGGGRSLLLWRRRGSRGRCTPAPEVARRKATNRSQARVRVLFNGILRFPSVLICSGVSVSLINEGHMCHFIHMLFPNLNASNAS